MLVNSLERRHFLFLAAAAAAAGSRLSALARADEEQSGKPEYTRQTFVYKMVGNLEIRADVYRTAAVEVQPSILWLHGGALMMASRGLVPPMRQLERYLASGYTFVSIDYRLAPETKLPAIVEDMVDAYAWLRTSGPSLFNIDPDRIAVMGMSAGAYLAQLAGIRLRPRPRALVSLYGYGDITGPWLSRPNPGFNGTPPISRERAYEGMTGPAIAGSPESNDPRRSTFNVYCRQSGLWTNEVSGHDPLKERSWFADYEPRMKVASRYPPTILLHGESDQDVPFEQSVLMARALKKHRVEYDFVSNPRWNHAFDYAKTDPALQEAFDRISHFLDEHLHQKTSPK